MNQAVLEVKNIHKTFGEVSVLKGVDFDIQKGEIHALVGENGAGKSTLIKIISGVYTRDSGFLPSGRKRNVICQSQGRDGGRNPRYPPGN